MHLIEKEKLKCEVCEKFFKHNESLKSHQQSVHGESRNFFCNICEITLNTMASFHLHYKKHKPIMNQCMVCGKATLTKNHDCLNVKIHKCNLCKMSFPTKSNLEIHQDGQMCLRCDHCGKYFITKGGLKKHTENCNGSRKWKGFNCDICAKHFNKSTCYSRHRKEAHLEVL